jgi:hypothetical protein
MGHVWTFRKKKIVYKENQMCVFRAELGLFIMEFSSLHHRLKMMHSHHNLSSEFSLFKFNPLVDHRACNTRVVGLIPRNTDMSNVCAHDLMSLWMKASAKWHIQHNELFHGNFYCLCNDVIINVTLSDLTMHHLRPSNYFEWVGVSCIDRTA